MLVKKKISQPSKKLNGWLNSITQFVLKFKGNLETISLDSWSKKLDKKQEKVCFFAELISQNHL